ncbi:MAG: transposase family protein [Pedobacter sp.]|nr:transposase family protein [Pedobacter sp.]
MDDWTSISMFGRSKLFWLRQYLPYKHGIPSRDVLGKVFAALGPVRRMFQGLDKFDGRTYR